jgi:hypothetical protein
VPLREWNYVHRLPPHGARAPEEIAGAVMAPMVTVPCACGAPARVKRGRERDARCAGCRAVQEELAARQKAAWRATHVHTWNAQQRCGCGAALADYVVELEDRVNAQAGDAAHLMTRILAIETRLATLEQWRAAVIEANAP